MRHLLIEGDPDPVMTHAGTSDWLLTVEHAGRAVPSVLGDLGLQPGEIDGHIGWDPGALDLAEVLADRLGSSLVAQRYSRLVIDCNRPWGAPDLVPEASDGVPVPANRTDDDGRQRRWDDIHVSFHGAVSGALDRGARRLMAVHTYDPCRRVDGAPRPWPIGLLARVANPLADGLSDQLARVDSVAPLGINQPYEIEDASDYTIPVHAEPRGLPHVLIEVRNDYLRDTRSVSEIADTICRACQALEPA